MFADPPTTHIYTLSLHDALPIFYALNASFERTRHVTDGQPMSGDGGAVEVNFQNWNLHLLFERQVDDARHAGHRSEEHTSELQSQSNLVCRLLLEKKKCSIPYIS